MELIKQQTNTQSGIIKKIARLTIWLELLLILSVIIWFHPNIRQTLTLATSVKPEPFTELSFENHLTLPLIVSPNHVYSFAFTIHNVENKDETYPYEVSLNGTDSARIIDKSTVVIKNDARRTIYESFASPPIAGNSAIIVTLLNKNQQILFYLTDEK